MELWDFTPIIFLAATLLYLRGVRRLHGRGPVKRWQNGSFFLGIAVLILTYLPPIDTAADQLFSMHMVQHLLITSLGVPLVLIGAPFFVWLRGLPPRARRNIFIPVARNSGVRRAVRIVRSPLPAVFLFEATYWFWHIPKFYNLALLNEEIHFLEHGCMALAAMNMWQLIIDSHPSRSPLKVPARILLLGFMMILDMALSAALTYSERIWYAYESLPSPDWWTWNRLQDQQFGGIIMWVAGSTVWLVAIGCLFTAWANQERQAEEASLLLKTG